MSGKPPAGMPPALRVWYNQIKSAGANGGSYIKKLYIIGGTMGIGKTTVCRRLKQKLQNCVFLDGDWCWDAQPFQVNEETKEMVLQNICFLLNQFIRCSAYQNVIFCWVMHEQSIIDAILNGIDKAGCDIKLISLVCSSDTLRDRLEKDVRAGIRTPDVIGRSIARLSLYDGLNTQKIDTDGVFADDVADMIMEL